MDFGIDDTLLILNGHTVEGGYSDDTDAIMFERIELADSRTGADGSKAYFRTGNKGSPFTLKLLPNSPSIPFFQQQAEIVRRGGTVIWNGSLRDTRRNVSATLRHGILRSYPPFPNYGAGAVSNMEYMFEFEETPSDFDAAAAGSFRAIGDA